VPEISDVLDIDAPVGLVWQALRDPISHAEWHPLVRRIVGDHALGEVRTCEVVLGGKDGQAVERCTTYDEGSAIAWTVQSDTSGFSRMVSDWSSGFRLEQLSDRRTRVTAWSAFRPRTFALRLMLPMVKLKFHRIQREVLGGLRAGVEGP
jgi:uncharacterized protein YndB with AHSA1/START domain